MEEASGTVFDSTANNNDLTVSANVTYQYPGKIDTYSMHFAGNASYLSGGTANTLGTFPLSISAWCVFSGSSSDQYILTIMQYSPTVGGFQLGVSSPSLNVGYLGFNYPGQSMPLSNYNLKDGQWHHIVATATGEVGINSIKYWVDGNDTTTASGYMSTTPVELPNHTYRVGNSYINNGGVVGEIDSLKVWNRVLSSDDVAYLYNSGSGRSCP